VARPAIGIRRMPIGDRAEPRRWTLADARRVGNWYGLHGRVNAVGTEKEHTFGTAHRFYDSAIRPSQF